MLIRHSRASSLHSKSLKTIHDCIILMIFKRLSFRTMEGEGNRGSQKTIRGPTSSSDSSLLSAKCTKSNDIPTVDTLCARCQSIDLGAAFQRDLKWYNNYLELGEFVADLAVSACELKNSKCALCRLFDSICPPDVKKDGSIQEEECCQLRAFSANGALSRLNPADIGGLPDEILLGIKRFSPSANEKRETCFSCASE
jgi:hypothetical protein